MVTSNKKLAIHQALTEAQIKQYYMDHKVKFITVKEVVSFTKQIIKAAKIKPLKETLKDTKVAIDSLPDNSVKANKRTIYKIIKVL